MKILSWQKYSDLAIRTLAPDVAKSTERSTLNAATGLSSEMGELVEVAHFGEQGPGHKIKELGDYAWYLSLMVTCYGLIWSEIVGTDNVDELARLFRANPNALKYLGIHTGKINALVKKEFFHGHPRGGTITAIAPVLSCAAGSWVGLCKTVAEPSEVLGTNIEKLKARYPEGFSTERSLHRAVTDL